MNWNIHHPSVTRFVWSPISLLILFRGREFLESLSSCLITRQSIIHDIRSLYVTTHLLHLSQIEVSSFSTSGFFRKSHYDLDTSSPMMTREFRKEEKKDSLSQEKVDPYVGRFYFWYKGSEEKSIHIGTLIQHRLPYSHVHHYRYRPYTEIFLPCTGRGKGGRTRDPPLEPSTSTSSTLNLYSQNNYYYHVVLFSSGSTGCKCTLPLFWGKTNSIRERIYICVYIVDSHRYTDWTPVTLQSYSPFSS